MIRKIVKIDEEKCDGCGLCVPACHEGALQIIDGKARLVSETYCDGLGDCLGVCPRDAISIEEREADQFEPGAVAAHAAAHSAHGAEAEAAHGHSHEGTACPGAASRVLRPAEAAAPDTEGAETAASRLANWPVQLRLVPAQAPYLQGADLVVAADCVPFAFADFHRRFLSGRVLLVGCPKLDDADAHREKLARIFAQNDVGSVEVVHMEVPCCFGLVHLVRGALQDAKKQIPFRATMVGIRGAVCETKDAGGVGARA